MKSFTPGVVAVASLVASVRSGQEYLYDPKADPKVGPNDTDLIAAGLQVGDPIHNGESAVTWQASFGNGRGSTLVKLSGDSIESVVDALDEFDPNEDLSGLPPAECVRRTIAVERNDKGEPTEITFKVTLAKNARTVRVPFDQWGEFREFLANEVAATIPAAVAHYRTEVSRLEAAEAAKAAKAAANQTGK